MQTAQHQEPVRTAPVSGGASTPDFPGGLGWWVVAFGLVHFAEVHPAAKLLSVLQSRS